MTTQGRRRSRLQRIGILVAGWLMILLGIVGLVLPFLQGILFLAIGVYLLSLESVWVKRRLDRLEQRYPQLYTTREKARLRAARVARRIRARVRLLRRR
ncbi:MAG: PGPGW domain-containing protein [Acetobacterales bacterium]